MGGGSKTYRGRPRSPRALIIGGITGYPRPPGAWQTKLLPYAGSYQETPVDTSQKPYVSRNNFKKTDAVGKV